jgi:tetratricopeptide (TPR) repeat protein
MNIDRRVRTVPSGQTSCHPWRVPDFSLGDAARILKVSPRRLRYWQKTQLVESPSVDREAADLEDVEPSEENEEAGEGYAFRDLVVLRAIVSLVDKGIPLQRIRRNLEILRTRLPELDDPAAALRLWDDESERLVVRNDGRLEEAGGQLLLEFEDDSVLSEESVSSLAEFDSDGAKHGANTPDQTSGVMEDAVEWFERGCELDAESSKWSAAIEAYERAVEIAPDYADAYCNLGAVRYNQGQRAEARRAFEACLAREADHVEANFNLANVLEEEGDDRAALVHYRRALAADPLYPDLHINLALLYEKIERPRPSRDHWRRYLQLDPEGSWAEVARMRLDRELDQA